MKSNFGTKGTMGFKPHRENDRSVRVLPPQVTSVHSMVWENPTCGLPVLNLTDSAYLACQIWPQHLIL